MCLPKEINNNKPKTIPRSPWRRLRQQLKPRLSRRVVPTAKINLNNFWTKFEELSDKQLPIVTFDLALAASQDNEINDNILNERMELGN